MRKRLTGSNPYAAAAQDWLPLDQLAQVEITSETAAHPIEAALLPGNGWRAGEPGQQTIRLIFDQPKQLRRIWLLFNEPEVERTQEFVLRWSPDHGRSFRQIVRQQWNFSPAGSTRQSEDYRVELDGVTVLELTITPDNKGAAAIASLAQMRLA